MLKVEAAMPTLPPNFSDSSRNLRLSNLSRPDSYLAGLGRADDKVPLLLTLDEREQILVNLILMSRAHAVRQARIDFQRGALDDLGREHG